ncbi:MAG: hypothetical protein JSR56_04465 [Proteobacteria bacterium]|nr:hypothetical protein [Pseudomonadota bacterium]
MPEQGFFRELRRRNVLRAAVLYIGAVWALAQGISQLTPALGLPDPAARWFLIACAVGLPFWLAFAWFYEFTPQGFKRDREVPADAPARQSNARKLDFAIIGVMALAILLLVSGYFLRGKAPAAATAAFNPPAASIVVLPFTNLSGGPGQAYFSNGITEELTDALGQNTGLTVIAWETASRYGGGKQTPEQIGKALNVAHVLGGSIEHEGDAVRVSAELVSTVNGRQLWSAQYDDTFRNIFTVQDQITAAIAGALNVKFAGAQAAPTLNPQAHELYLKGLAALERFTAADAQAAQQYFQQALKLDPNYADAWAELAYSYLQLSEVSTLPIATAMTNARAAARKALALDPRNVRAQMESGRVDDNEGHVAQARAEFELAVALDPNNARAHNWYASVLPLKQALAQDQEAARLNPDSSLAQFSLGYDYLDLRDWRNAATAARRAATLSPHEINGVFELAYAYAQMQQGKDAVRAFDLAEPNSALDKQLIGAGRLTYQARLDPVRRPDALSALDKLRHAGISPDAQFQLMSLYAVLGEKEPVIRMLPGVCTSFPDACGDLAINPMFAALHGDPRFEKLAQQYTTITPDSAPASASTR